MNTADTLPDDLSVKLHNVFRPLQIPDHPSNAFPAAGIAVSVILEPAGNEWLQLAPQVIVWLGELICTVPLAAPVLA